MIRDSLQELFNIVKKGNSIIAGSYAMYNYMTLNHLEPQFLPNDIDIFTFNDNKELIDFYYSLPRHGRQAVNVGDGQNYGPPSCMAKHIYSIASYSDGCNKLKIQIIMIDRSYTKTLVDYVNEHFDLDICKCWSDGYNFYGPYDLLKNKICYVDLSKAWNKDQLKMRIKKYTSRGFKFKIYNNL